MLKPIRHTAKSEAEKGAKDEEYTNMLNKLKQYNKKLTAVFCFLAVERFLDIFSMFEQEELINAENKFSALINETYWLMFNFDKKSAQYLIGKTGELAPDSEDYSGVVASQVRCGSSCLYFLLKFLLTNDFINIQYALNNIAESNYLYGCHVGEEHETLLNQIDLEWQYLVLDLLIEGEAYMNKNTVDEIRAMNRQHQLLVAHMVCGKLA